MPQTKENKIKNRVKQKKTRHERPKLLRKADNLNYQQWRQRQQQWQRWASSITTWRYTMRPAPQVSSPQILELFHTTPRIVVHHSDRLPISTISRFGFSTRSSSPLGLRDQVLLQARPLQILMIIIVNFLLNIMFNC